MKSLLVFVLLAAFVLVPGTSCRSTNSSRSADCEARDLQQLDAAGDSYPPLANFNVFALKELTDRPQGQELTDDIKKAQSRGLTYAQVSADTHRYAMEPIVLSGNVVRIRSHAFGTTNGLQAYVAVDGPGDRQKASSGGYVLALSPNNSTVHDGDRCLVVGYVGDHGL
ncbi:MAG TPA: hypothetical protein VLZ81_04895, partial [Blastocatellia bacterium]|nr:hypothetical protein [Blastocatellia bacterium]